LEKELRNVLSNVSSNGLIHIDEMERDLLQVNLLLMDAIGTMGEHFLEIGRLARRQQQAVRTMESASASDMAVQMGETLREMETRVHAIVTAMQFQDMTSQLIAGVLSHADAARRMMGYVRELADDLVRAEGASDVSMMLSAAVRELGERRRELEHRHAKMVQQERMDSGSVELF
jgi:hypothetical protein